MTKSFLCFELLWGFEGRTWNEEYRTCFYGIAVPFLFFGFVTATQRKVTHGKQA
jgi:hypothetical protein